MDVDWLLLCVYFLAVVIEKTKNKIQAKQKKAKKQLIYKN